MRKNIERDIKRYKRKLRRRCRTRQKKPKRFYSKNSKDNSKNALSSLQQAHMQARKTFNKMPEEVCKLWLYDRIANCGWPPAGPEWQGFLFDKSIGHWQQLDWEEKSISLHIDKIAPISMELVSKLIEAHEYGMPNILTLYMPDSKPRYDSINDYLTENQKVPGKIILLETELGFEIVDGAHRITAALMFQLKNSLETFKFTAWVGKPVT